jgi:hypothetical protein
MHTADGGYAAARPSCMNLPAFDEMPATERAETSIISRLASSIFVSDCFLLVRVSRAVVTRDTCCPRALRPENTTYSSALPCCARALVLRLAFPSAIVSCFFYSLISCSSKATARTGFVHTPNFTLMQVRIMLACGCPRPLRLFCDYSSVV